MKLVKLSLAAAMAMSAVMAGGDIAPVEPVVEAPAAKADYGTVFGQARAFYIDRTYKNGISNNRNSLAVGGYIGYTTPSFEGLKFTVAAYGTYGFDIHNQDADVIGKDSYDPSLYGRNFDNYAFIGQAYLDYTYANTNVKIGRQKLDTPMAGSDDTRMLPNLFEAAVLTNTDIQDTTLVLAHVTKETVGTFGSAYYGLTDLGLVSGYGVGPTSVDAYGMSGDFTNMGVIALGAGNHTDGVTAAAAIYKGIPDLTLQAWDYYAHDIANIVYLQADYGWNCKLDSDIKMVGSLQYINESDVGDSLAGDINSNYWGAQLSATYGNFNAKAAYSQTDSGVGILSPWGGMPAFTQGMVTRHQFFSDTDAWKLSAGYNFTQFNLNATVYYASFDVGQNNGGYSNLNTRESGFDLIYQATNDLQFRFRGNFPEHFGLNSSGTSYDWDEYRFIVNYNF